MQSAFVKNWFPPNERGKANGAWLLGLMIGPAVAMPFFTWIISSWGWRPSFFVLASMGLIPLFLLYFFVTDHPRQHKGVNKAELDYIENALRAEAAQEEKHEGGKPWPAALIFLFQLPVLAAYD